MSAILAVAGLSISFGGLKAVEAVDMAVDAHSIHGLIGPNGSGKTTLLNLISGFYIPTAGRIHFAGQDITGSPPHAVARPAVRA